MGKSQDLYNTAKKFIPGGTQLLSKRPEMFLPDLWPAYYSKAKGCAIWDLDGNEYLDMSFMGIGAAVLGYADADVDAAVKKAIDAGNLTTLNAPEEVELAELMCALHPWAKKIRYARTGGEAAAMAVRIARAYSRKDIVLFCGYHGWHDWYLSANLNDDNALDSHLLTGLNPLGVPKALRGTAFPFNYNRTDQFLGLIERVGYETGVVIIEGVRNTPPSAEFLSTIRRITKEKGIVLICDEITSGFRLCSGGAHLYFEWEPDLAIFGKGIGNGYPMAMVLGKKEVMDVAQDTFISSTFWTDRLGPASALATIKKFRELKVANHLIESGKKIKKIWAAAAEESHVEIEISGIDPLAHLEFKNKNSLACKTLFTQEMLAQGFLASTSYYASLAHREEHISAYQHAARKAFSVIAKAMESGDPVRFLKSAICHSGFKRLA